MSLRPVSAQWFELLVPKSDLAIALEGLAHSNSVELETLGSSNVRLVFPDLQAQFDEFTAMADLYRVYWPQIDPTVSLRRESPAKAMECAMARLRGWAEEARGPIAQLQRLETEREGLETLRQLLQRDPQDLPSLPRLANAGPFFKAALFFLPEGRWPTKFLDNLLWQQIAGTGGNFLLALGSGADIDALQEQIGGLRGRLIELPNWLPDRPQEGIGATEKRLAELKRSERDLRRSLAEIAEDTKLAAALNDVAVLVWFLDQAKDLGSTSHFAWVTGWTTECDERLLSRLLRRKGVQGLLRLTAPPPAVHPPTVLRNPAWVRPFEVFAGLLGTPSDNEADPSQIVALLAPLLFGFMFADVGQGLVLLLAGLFLRRKLPVLALLVPGGVMAIAFGFLFGSFFSREDIIPALWLHPLEDPVTLLALSLAAGAAILLLGLVLNAVEAHWRGEFTAWVHSQAGLLLAFLAMLSALWETGMFWIGAGGVLWYIVGSAMQSSGTRAIAFAKAAASALESLVQLLVNTVSFARVGAFALAHAGLSAAISGLADVTGHIIAAGTIMVLGNLVVIMLEGLVTSIQTTRLLLFEFFIRFLRAEGRPFNPLPPPVLAAPRPEGNSA